MTKRSIDSIKWLSNNSIYSSVVKMNQLPMDYKYYRNKINYPLLFIVIVSKSDFRYYANLTRSLNSNAFRVIMIFEREARVCHNPEGNPLNLVFDSMVLVKCHDSEIIREWYSVYPNKTEIYDLVRWHKNEEHQGNEYTTDVLFNERRQDLGGLTIRVSFHKELIGQDGKIVGMAHELVTEIAKRINLTIAWQPPASFIGMLDQKTNTVDGILRNLALKKTDLGMGFFAMTTERLKLFDFSMPLIETRLSYFMKSSNDNVRDFMKYSAMTNSSTFSIYGIMFVSSIILSMIMLTDKVRFSNSTAQIFMDQFYDSMAIIFNGNVTHDPVRISARIIHFFLLTFYLLSNAIIVAKLTSLRAVYKPSIPSLDEIFTPEHNTHKLITLSNSPYMENLSVRIFQINFLKIKLQKFNLVGILSAVKKKWILIGRPDEDTNNFEAATIKTVKFPFIVLSSGISLSLIILICEKIYHRFIAR
uniref:Ionotropic glutamate receptor L-glutamate and glycine-binding domain-containing protein n=1 Tax=Trichogramma kaykai TaxID=54128 RepID=A0ABD2X8Z6_9HYME